LPDRALPTYARRHLLAHLSWPTMLASSLILTVSALNLAGCAPQSQPVASGFPVAVTAPQPVPEPVPLPEEVVDHSPPDGWQPPNKATHPYPAQVEQWRPVAQELIAEAYEEGRLDGNAAALDDDVVLAVIEQESSGNPNAYAWDGGIGLMQLMPPTYALTMLGDESLAYTVPRSAMFDVNSNMRAGIRYLARGLQAEDGNLYWTLASYNAGITTVSQFRTAGLDAVPPIGGYAGAANYAQITLRNYLSRRPDVEMYVPSPMPAQHVPGALRLLARVGF
jgi:soluble lytic murein transglycosylase-like protein